MATTFARTLETQDEAEVISADFWGWFGPKVDAWDARNARDVASAPERDEESRTILGAELLDIEFEPVSQAPLRTCVRCGNQVHSDDPTPTHKCAPVMSQR